jgi:hypothetical protein
MAPRLGCPRWPHDLREAEVSDCAKRPQGHAEAAREGGCRRPGAGAAVLVRKLRGLAPHVDAPREGEYATGPGRLMPWAKLDDGMHSHPKFMRVSLGATGVWAIGLSYAADYMTDGYVPRAVIAGRDDAALAFADELVEAGLWDAADRGWTIHDYLEFNPSREFVIADRLTRSVKAKNAADKRWGKRGASGEDAPGTAPGTSSPPPSAPDGQGSGMRSVDAPGPDPDPTRSRSVSTDVETDNNAVVVVPPPASVREEIDRACDTLAAAGMNVHDRTTVQRLADENPDVDIAEAAIRCADWLRKGRRRARHPLPTLTPFVTADDAPKKAAGAQKADYAKYDRGTIRSGGGSE